MLSQEMISDDSIAQVGSAGAGNYYTNKDNYYVLERHGRTLAGRGL